ncbi:MAG: ABC transporter permease, partial [Clostridia bacterium]|nr:ABC transporter permease [Clostridia bacterium]
MLFRMIRGVLFHQKGKMLLIALTIALGASLATGMLNVVLGVEEKVNKELKNYGANITVKPKDSSLLSDIYDVGEGSSLNAAYLREDELGRLKTIFWAFNIVDFTPFLDTQVTLPDGSAARMTGTWFNHHLDLPTGESLDAGVVGMRSWWDVTEGRWLDEKDGNAASEIMAGTLLAQKMGWHAGDTVHIAASQGEKEVTIAGVFDAGSDEDEQIFAALDLVQALTDRENKVASIEVSALTTPDNELARRAARNPAALSSRDYETWYCTAYVS